ncbi:MAG: ligase-associated DNA damage response exonuclease [Acidobacteriota bacterium]|nr:ligase-associated DNA damage response exonuclease [Acidobacteriota bacterium]
MAPFPKPLLAVTPDGLFCEQGNFHVDPWCPVGQAVVTHAHSDHARWGSQRYLTSKPGEGVLRARMGADAVIEGIPYGEPIYLNGVRVSLHPAGHILGSSQARVEYGGEVWVASGDYKVEQDATCTAFEPVRCNTFITESTFGLPIYRWRPESEVFTQVNQWWRDNQDAGRASVLFAYSLGKAQRLIAGVDPAIGPIFCHGAVQKLNQVYRDAGIVLPETHYSGGVDRGHDWSRALIVAPPSCNGTTWMRKFGAASTAFASGWMRVRGTRRRRSLDRGFTLSDHADWPGLLAAIDATGAEQVLVTHGYRAPLVRWLTEHGKQARSLETRYEGERDEEPVEAEP